MNYSSRQANQSTVHERGLVERPKHRVSITFGTLAATTGGVLPKHSMPFLVLFGEAYESDKEKEETKS
jgi:hypothetical protein